MCLLVLAFIIYTVKIRKTLYEGILLSENVDEMIRQDDSTSEEVVIQASGVSSTDAFSPHSTKETDPNNYLESWSIEANSETIYDISKYKSSDYFGDISFDVGTKYTDCDGIFTFRGNNFRDSAVYGSSEIKDKTMSSMWNVSTGSLTYEDAVWTGSGWTGQPLMRKWSRQAKLHMNMYDWAKEKDELVEVVYACMDGYVYFLDLDTGEPTRDKLWLGFTFKGAGALDPRGYPVLYLGAGYDSEKGYARAFVISLLDCSVLKEFGSVDPFAVRSTLSYFDSSALVDANTDTLIYPGENGVLYLIHLGTHYDEDAGTLTMDFDQTVKWKYKSKRTTVEKYWPGMETSAAIYEHYLYITDNGANLLCIDLDTLTPVWVQDILDDSNSTPVLSIEEGHVYLYVSTSFHYGWRSMTTATIPIWKIDAQTGEIVWKNEYECSSREGVSGGVQSTIAPGKWGLDNYIFVTVSMTHGGWEGDIVALNKNDGSKAWENRMPYTWSSPVCVYGENGDGYVIYGASDGCMYELDGKDGSLKSTLDISDGNIEASPAVYNNELVIGTRAGRICGIKLN
ncbi:MAG: pyrrolo-quinoline quinone [Lachnospiraceae bacterium]|nr:pyrrolo-quinoline quinone [Lachnospiraceae bacterium]